VFWKLVVVAGAYGVAVFAGGFFTQRLCRWLVERADDAGLSEWVASGVPHAGRLIGWLERFLIVTFVLMNQPGAVAVVLAAKGLLRFGEIKGGPELDPQRRVAEYVIVGTLFSFSFAVAVAALARWVLNLLPG